MLPQKSEEDFLPLVETQTSISVFPQSTGTMLSFCTLMFVAADYSVLVLLQMAVFYSCFFLPMIKEKKTNREKEVPSC